MGKVTEAPVTQDIERMMTHYVGDDCPGSHHDEEVTDEQMEHRNVSNGEQ